MESRPNNERQVAEEMASRLIAQRETGPWAAEDAAMLEAWLAESPSHRAAYYRFHAAWKEAGRMTVLARTKERTSRPFLTDVNTLTPSPSPASGEGAESSRRMREMSGEAANRSVRRYAIAASLLLAVGMLGFYLSRPASNEFETAVGGLATVPMSDGSRVTLNTDSQIRIDVSDTRRSIRLERGEAFFEVAKDSHRPFTVIAGNKRITAIGTAFSVRRNNGDIQVLVTQGRVLLQNTQVFPSPESGEGLAILAQDGSEGRKREGVRDSGKGEGLNERGAEGILLAAGSVAKSEGTALLVKKADVAELEQRLTWRTGTLTFRDTPLAEAAAEFNRYNDRKIVIEEPSIGAIEVGGIFRATDLDPFVHLLLDGFPVTVTERGDQIVLSQR